jgi:hypothetical protein
MEIRESDIELCSGGLKAGGRSVEGIARVSGYGFSDFEFRFSSGCEVTDEGSIVGQEDLFEVQDRAPCWRGEGDLRKSKAQATARMNSKIEIRNSKLAPGDVTPAKGEAIECWTPALRQALRGNDVAGEFRVSRRGDEWLELQVSTCPPKRGRKLV